MDIKSDVISRLKELGYKETIEDWFLQFLINETENSILSDINCEAIPAKLHEVEVNMICGKFLQNQKAKAGGIEKNLPGFDIDGAIKRVSEGDTTVEYAVGAGEKTAEQRFDILISMLITKDKDQFAHFRRLRW